jgi:hypothetical protein
MPHGVRILPITFKILALDFAPGHKSCLFAVYANGSQFVSIVYGGWNHTDHVRPRQYGVPKKCKASRATNWLTANPRSADAEVPRMPYRMPLIPRR